MRAKATTTQGEAATVRHMQQRQQWPVEVGTGTMLARSVLTKEPVLAAVLLLTVPCAVPYAVLWCDVAWSSPQVAVPLLPDAAGHLAAHQDQQPPGAHTARRQAAAAGRATGG